MFKTAKDIYKKILLVQIVRFEQTAYTLYKKWSFPFRISSVNVTKSAETSGSFIEFSSAH